MGVSGLWTLLEPVGKRVNIQALAGKTLAIDASIWIFQFLNTMRDDEGNFIRNGHLMGFFRRICRLLFNRIRPVFVFDGATPALKRLTVAARRRRRELQAAKVRKTAEKLLMKKLKAHLLEEEKAARAATKAQKAAAAAQKKVEREASKALKPVRKRKTKDSATAPEAPDTRIPDRATDADGIAASDPSIRQGRTAAPSGAMEQGAGTSSAILQAAPNNASLPVDEAAAAAQAAEIAEAADMAEAAEIAETAEIAEAAAALEDDVEVQAHDPNDGSEEESDGELDLDAIMNAGGELDPAAVGQLPPSLQLEVLTKHREQQAQLNRARFQEASKDAEGFSSLQMTSYIKQTELRRKMEAVRASSAQARSSTAKGHFVLEDHAQDEPTQVRVQLHSAGKGPSEWNRHVMNAAKKAPYGKHRSEAFVPPVSLAGVLPGMPQLIKAPRQSPDLEQGGTAAPAAVVGGGASVAEVHADSSHVTAEELAAALLGDAGGFSASDAEAAEDDDLEWEDAGVPVDVHPSTQHGSVEAAGPLQPQRRDVWTRTHGYKFGRKLGDWSGGGDDPAAEVSPAQDPLEAAALSAAADAAAAEGGPADASVQEQRSLQHGILNSLGVREPDADAAALRAADGAGAVTARGDAGVEGAARFKAHSAAPSIAVRSALAEPSGVGDGAQPDGRAGSPVGSNGGDGDDMEWEDAVPGGSPEMMGPSGGEKDGGVPSGRRKQSAVEGRSGGATGGIATVAVAAAAVGNEPARVGLKMSMPKWGGGRTAGGGGAGGGGAGGQRPLRQASGAAPGVAAAGPPQHSSRGERPHSAKETAAMAQPADVSTPRAVLADVPHRDAPGSATAGLRAPGAAGMNTAPLDQGQADAAPVSGSGHAGHESPTEAAEAQRSGDSAGVPDSDPAGSQAALEAAPATRTSAAGSAPAEEPLSGSAGAAESDPGTAADATGALDDASGALDDEGGLADEGIADEEVAAAIAAEELDDDDEPAAVDGEAVVVVADDAAGSERDAGVGMMPPAAGRSSGGPVAKAAAGTLDAFLPQNDATDLERRLRDVMGEVRGAKRSFKKQSGTDDVPTEMMFKECQEMLQLFGIPYIIAPTEAEAQCAWLEEQGLVDGVVTDDNDALLFGASHVYRHFFKDKQYCEQYLKPDWERDLGLTKEKLALLALLLGSDYTEGISGIGVVNAMETLAAFPSYEALKDFKSWLDSPNLEAFRHVTGKKGRTGVGIVGEDSVQSSYKTSHQQACKAWEVPASFPDHKVLDAYARPSVDTNKTAFSFLKPDLEILRGYCHKAFGWSQDATDSLLVPVLQEYDKRQSQLRLDAFYTMTHRFAKIKSKRLQAAVSTAMGRQVPEEMVLSESLVAEAAAESGRHRQLGNAADQSDLAAKMPQAAQARQISADAGLASRRKRRRTASGPPAQAWQDNDDPDSDGEYVNNVMQGFFY